MKKLILVVLGMILVCTPAFAGTAFIGVNDTITAAVSAGGEYTGITEAGAFYDMKYAGGVVTAQVSVAGSGTLTMTYLGSNDGVTFVEPESVQEADDILSGITSSDGTVLVQFTPIACKYIMYDLVESGGSSNYTATIKTAIYFPGR